MERDPPTSAHRRPPVGKEEAGGRRPRRRRTGLRPPGTPGRKTPACGPRRAGRGDRLSPSVTLTTGRRRSDLQGGIGRRRYASGGRRRATSSSTSVSGPCRRMVGGSGRAGPVQGAPPGPSGPMPPRLTNRAAGTVGHPAEPAGTVDGATSRPGGHPVRRPAPQPLRPPAHAPAAATAPGAAGQWTAPVRLGRRPRGVRGDVGWARLGSNQRPTDYESAALTD